MNIEHLPDEPLWAAFRAQWRADRPPRIVVHGGYGKGNLGDDTILEAILTRLRREWPDAAVAVISHGPAWVQATHGPGLAAYHFRSPGAWRAIAWADLYIIGGGGIMNRINAYSGLRRLRVLDPKGKYQFVAALLAHACGARVALYCISTTSVPDPLTGRLARLALGCADWVTVREPLSVQVLRGLGVRRALPITWDPAHEVAPAGPDRAREILAAEGVRLDRPLVAIDFRYVVEPDIDNAATVLEVARLADALATEYNARVLFVPFSRHPRAVVENDVCFAAEVQARLQRSQHMHVLSRPYAPAEVKGILSLARVCIMERHHAVLYAAAVGVPVVGVIYDDKVAQYLDMRGLPAGIPLRQFSAQRALQAVDALVPGLKER